MKKNEYKIVVKGTEHKFDTFEGLYLYFDYEVNPNDFDDIKVYVNGHYLGTSPTKIANDKSYKWYI